MAQGGFGIKVIGAEELKRALKQLGRLDERQKNRIIKGALGKAAKPIIKNARARLRGQTKGSGLLAKSLGIKTKTYRRSGVSVAIIGPKAGFSGTDDKGRRVNPEKYAHLVERGHRIAVGGTLAREGKATTSKNKGKHTGDVPAKPFLKPALENNRQTIINTFRRELPIRLTKLAQKLAKKKK